MTQHHELKILDQLAPNEDEGDETSSFLYGLCSCGTPVQGARTEDGLRANHDKHQSDVHTT